MRPVVVLGLLAFGVYSVLVPPTSGPGWSLDETQTQILSRPLLVERGVVLYSSDDGHPLLVVNVFDSSHCPPEGSCSRDQGGQDRGRHRPRAVSACLHR